MIEDESIRAPEGDDDEPIMPIEGHLEELRTRIIRGIGFFFLACMLSFYLSDMLLALVVRTASDQSFIFLSPIEPIMVKLKISVLCGFVLAIPYVLFEAWAFVRPGLKPVERRYSLLFIPPIIVSFALGALFAYFIFLPVAIRLFLELAGPNLEAQFSIAQYTEFILMFMFLFGLLAELPLVLLFLAKIGLIDSKTLCEHRPTVIVSMFIISGLFTPPDWITQVFVAVPVVLLFELGIFLLRFFDL